MIVSLAATVVDPRRTSTSTVRCPSTSARVHAGVGERLPGREGLAVVPDADLAPAAVDVEVDEAVVGARRLVVDHDGVGLAPTAEVLHPAVSVRCARPVPDARLPEVRVQDVGPVPRKPIQPVTASSGEA